MLEIELIVDAADESDRLIPRPERPPVLLPGKRSGVAGLGLPGMLLWMARSASRGTDVLAGCRGQQQRGQYANANYQISRPLN